MSISFQTVPFIESGLGKISILPDLCKRFNIKKPIIITDKGLFDLGLVEKVEQSLKKDRIDACIYKDVLADPPESNIFDAVKLYDDFGGLPEEVQLILANMMFNMGRTRLSKFKNMNAAVEEGDWNRASQEMMNSRWYNQVRNRARRLVERMRNV